MRLPRIVPGLLAVTLAAGACTSDDNTQGSTTDLKGDKIILTSGLVTESNCDALLKRLIDEGLERVGPYGFGNGGYPVFFDGDMAEDDATDEAAGTLDLASGSDDGGQNFSDASSPLTTVQASDGETSSPNFSGTNNQEGGVDEGDIVKTDGKRLVTASGGTIRVIDTTGETPVLVHTIDLNRTNSSGSANESSYYNEIWVQEMFLVGDKVLALSQGWVEDDRTTGSNSSANDAISIWETMPAGIQTTNLTEINLVDGTIGETITLQGNYVSGREVDGVVRLVVNSNPGQLPFVYPSNPGSEDVAEETNRDLLKQSTLEQWIPGYKLGDGSHDQLIPCDQMHIPTEFSGFGTLAVLTLDLAANNSDGLELASSVGVLTEGHTIYASTTRLAVATTRWQGDFFLEGVDEDGISESDQDKYTTAIHSFDISVPSATTYVASGSVDGHMLNQYSMSEHDGHLRVAMTEGSPWGDSSESSVVVLAEQGPELVQVGKVGGLGKGEQIKSVRFMGDTAYVVTFRQVDPLYTVDLSDPANPTVIGELKIPGFSSYLHPIGNGQLIGIGQDGTDEGRVLGAQISVFDVANMAEPTRIDSLAFGDNSQSSIAWDAKSFSWWAPTRTAFMPLSSWGEDSGTEYNHADVVALRIDTAGLVSELGRISHPVTKECEGLYGEEDGPAAEEAGIEIEPDGQRYCWSYQAEIRRTVIINNSIYTVSDDGVKKSDLVSLADQAWIDFK